MDVGETIVLHLMTMRAYVWAVLACAAAAMGALFAFTSYVDPFYYWGSRDRPGINAIRYGAVDYPETAKTYSVAWYRPRSLIMGSSRAQIGLDPSHKGFAHQPVYSLAYPGSAMRRTLALFEHAVATSEIKQVVLALDFFVFRAATYGDDEFVRLAALPDGLAPKWTTHWRARATDFWLVNFSSAAIKLAAFDVRANSRGAQAMRWTMRRDGHNELVNPQGFDNEAMFGAVEGSFAKIYLNGDFCLSSRPGYSSLGDLRTLIGRARDLGIDLRIVLSPVHANLAEIIDRSGLWSTWETWKREIVRMAAPAPGSHWSAPVFDFSGYNAVTTEPVPIGAPDVQMKNYWDPSHYKRNIGNEMLDVALGTENPPAHPGFGRQITPETIEKHFEAIRNERASWRAQHPEQVSRIKGLPEERKAEKLCMD